MSSKSERDTRFELATSSLGSLDITKESGAVTTHVPFAWRELARAAYACLPVRVGEKSRRSVGTSEAGDDQLTVKVFS